MIAGQNTANPLATILSAGMMLDWLGETRGDQTCANAALIVEQAVAKVLQDGSIRTPDIGGNSSTNDVAEAVSDALANAAMEKV